MIYDGILDGKQIYLRALALSDCEGRYLSWLNHDEINRYLESRLCVQTLESTQRFVLDMRESPDNYMFAIVARESNTHIGNIKIGPIHPLYKNAFIGYLIGEKEYWGKGIATEAILLATKFCFETLDLNKINAGVIAPNIGSIRALEKCGFTQEGRFTQEVVIDNLFRDTYRYGILKQKFKEK